MAEQIPERGLIVGKWYVGRGRNGNIGMWDGYCFLVIAEKFDDYVIKQEPYYTEDWGCFQPFAVIDEGTMIEPFGKVGWAKHYGRRMEFDAGHVQRTPEPVCSQLAGCWIGSAYYGHGARVDYFIFLNGDQTFKEIVRDYRNGKYVEHINAGSWLHDQDEHLLHLKSDAPVSGSGETTWCILAFTGTTLMLRWLALAPRNLPVLFYRVDPNASDNP